MELRWFDGKLEYRDIIHPQMAVWHEVPQMKSERKEPCCEWNQAGGHAGPCKETTIQPQKWPCEHIAEVSGVEVLFNRPSISAREVAMWKFCPICGTPRPKSSERSLEEKLRDDYALMSDAMIRNIASICRHHFSQGGH